MQIMRSAQVIIKLQFGAIALISIAQISIAFDIYCVNLYCGQNYCVSGYCAISIHPPIINCINNKIDDAIISNLSFINYIKLGQI